jgi:hypothetical protein
MLRLVARVDPSACDTSPKNRGVIVAVCRGGFGKIYRKGAEAQREWDGVFVSETLTDFGTKRDASTSVGVYWILLALQTPGQGILVTNEDELGLGGIAACFG